MSDPVDRAVDARIDAYRPDTVPPYSAIEGRKRSRDRRRNMLTVAAPVLAAVLVAPVAWTAVTSGGDELVQQTGPAEEAGSSRAAFLPSQGEGRSRLALASGLLGGDPSTGCLWLSAADSPDSIAGPILILHDTAVADFTRTPWVIRDGDTVLATESEQVELVGGHTPDGSDMSVPGCPVAGQPFSGLLDPESAPDPDAPVLSEPTRYTITYSDAAIFEEHVQAVTACVALPGTSDVRSNFPLPPLTGVTVTGADENRDFQACFSPLNGVTLALTSPGSTQPSTTSDVPCSSPQEDALGLVGLSEAEAEARARDRGYMFRVTCRDGVGIPGSLDFSNERVNVRVVAGQVTAGSIG